MCEQTLTIAMSIIMAAGDARLICKQALDALSAGNIDAAKDLHTSSKKKIAEAHHLQTDAIQGEMAGGDALEYSPLFTHAQDTLMTVYSEINIAKHLITICGNYECRLQDLERRLDALESV